MNKVWVSFTSGCFWRSHAALCLQLSVGQRDVRAWEVVIHPSEQSLVGASMFSTGLLVEFEDHLECIPQEDLPGPMFYPDRQPSCSRKLYLCFTSNQYYTWSSTALHASLPLPRQSLCNHALKSPSFDQALNEQRLTSRPMRSRPEARVQAVQQQPSRKPISKTGRF